MGGVRYGFMPATTGLPGGIVLTTRGLSRLAPMLLVAAVAMTSCSGDEPRPRQSPGAIEGELVSTDDALPEEFPSDLPRPGSPTVIYSAVSKLGSVVYFTSQSDATSIADEMLEQLPRAGWKVYSCVKTPGANEDTFFITAGKERAVASVLVGFLASNAERIGGKRYSYLISIANDAPEPVSNERTCRDE